jgi:hypothetical protein
MPAKTHLKVVRKTVVQQTLQPSKVMGFTPSVPVERSLYKQGMVDDPNFWGSEYGYLGDMAADDSATPPEKPWYEKLVDIYGAVKAQQTAAKYQDQLIQENIARQKAGTAPLSMDTYMKYAAPQVNVGLSPTVQNILIYGGLGLLGIFAVSMFMKRR